jgi:hypothetical protein
MITPNKDKWKDVINRSDVVDLRNHILNSFKDLEFEEERHKYFLHGRELRSVSKVVESFAPKFDEKEQAQKCYEKYYNKEDSKYFGMTPQQILKEWKKINKKSCDLGHAKHSYAEDLFDYYTGKTDTIELPDADDYMSWNSIRFWEDLPVSYIPLLSECRVYSEKLKYSGTFDLLCAWDRPNIPLQESLVLLDYKSNRDLFKNFNDQRMLQPFEYLQDSPICHYKLQLSLYEIPLTDIGCKVIDRVLIYLNEDKQYYGKYKLENYTEQIKNILK